MDSGHVAAPTCRPPKGNPRPICTLPKQILGFMEPVKSPKGSKSSCSSCLPLPPPLPSSPLQSVATCLSMWFPVLPTQRAMSSRPPAKSDPPFTADQHLCPAVQRPVLTSVLLFQTSTCSPICMDSTRPVLESYGAHLNYTTQHNKSDSLTLNFSKVRSQHLFKKFISFCPISIWDCAGGGCSRTSATGRWEAQGPAFTES